MQVVDKQNKSHKQQMLNKIFHLCIRVTVLCKISVECKLKTSSMCPVSNNAKYSCLPFLIIFMVN